MAQKGLFPDSPEAGYIVQGKYRLENKLSEGGGGVVWEATDPHGKHIALKFLKWSPTKTRSEVADRFKNEFAILKNLAHPNISEIYDFGIDSQSDLYFFTSELLTSGDFRMLIGAPIPVLEDMLLQSLRSLEYLRSNKLLHLDIKPHNLLLREEGNRRTLALIDFGLATFRPPDRPGGTPNYMAPELIAMRIGEGHELLYPPPDHRSDLYSLGVTFYHCLTGVQPFAVKGANGALDVMATLRQHLEHTPPPPSTHRPEIPAYLDRIIMKLMARHPDDRYPSAIVAAQALQYASPNEREPECMRTLLAYLPKEGKLINRKHEYALAEESIESVAEGKPHVAPIVCIAGGRGVGRSRLLQAIKPLAQQHEMEVSIFSEGDPLTANALGEILAGDGTRSPARAVLIDDFEHILEHHGNGSGDGATMEAFVSLLKRLKIQQRIPNSPPPRLFLAFALDTDRVDISRAMMELELDHAVCHIVELANFKRGDVSDYLAALLGEAPDDSVVDQLMKCTEGNPLYITEHLEQMISEGRLFSLAGRPDANTLKSIGIDFSQAAPPKSLAESVMEKLDALPMDTQRAALAMACWHRPVSVEELAATSATHAIDKEVLALVGAGLVKRDKDSGRLSFDNALTARIIRDHSKRDDVASAHDAIAGYLRARRVRRSQELDVHLAYGSNAAERIPALSRMANRALDGREPLEAAHHLEAMYPLLGETDWTDRIATLEHLGKAYARAHRDDEAKAAYGRIAELTVPTLMKQELRAKSAELTGLLAMRRRKLAEAHRHFEKALEFLNEGGNHTAARLRIQNYMASVDLREGNIERALDSFERSRNVAEKALADEEMDGVTNNELGDALIRAGRIEEAIEVLSADLESAIKADDPERIASKHYLLGNAYRHDTIRKYKEAMKHYADGLKIARSHRLIEEQVRILNGLGNLNLMLQKPREAMANYREGLKLAQQMEGETTSVEIMIGMGLVSQQQHEPESTIELFEAALDFSKTPKASSAGLLKRYSPTMYVFLGDAYYQKHDLEHAEEYLRKALDIDRRHALTPDIRYSLYGTFVEMYLEQGRTDDAEELMPTVEAIAKAFPPAAEHLRQLKKRMHH
jgi:serine/threonine protein kinase/tetratricopeptide (TPR) repeat protein